MSARLWATWAVANREAVALRAENDGALAARHAGYRDWRGQSVWLEPGHIRVAACSSVLDIGTAGELPCVAVSEVGAGGLAVSAVGVAPEVGTSQSCDVLVLVGRQLVSNSSGVHHRTG